LEKVVVAVVAMVIVQLLGLIKETSVGWYSVVNETFGYERQGSP
jgi:hypothetical protein